MAPVDDREESVAWRLDNVVLTTVGIDVGSSTSHLTFSRLWLQRQSQELSSRFVVVERTVLYRSPISLTPYRGDGLIDVQALSAFIDRAYAEAGFARSAVDSGAVILTGVALERANSRSIADLFSSEGGKFVCASAGHILEAILAAYGSGAVALSRARKLTVLNIDLGGGTTKFSLIRDGRIEATMAVGVGARLISFGEGDRVARLEPHGRLIARLAGIEPEVGAELPPVARQAIGKVLARLVISCATGAWPADAPRELILAGHLPTATHADLITFSGGVSEFVYGRAERSYGDLAQEFSAALRQRFPDLGAPVGTPEEGIRATVMGASQYTVQLSGNTVYLSDEHLLPMRNLPVVALPPPPDDADPDALASTIRQTMITLGLEITAGPLAIAVPWQISPSYEMLRFLAEGLVKFHEARGDSAPLVVALAQDVALNLGRLIADDLGRAIGLVVLDDLDLQPLDYLDVGELLRPANVVPVVIKSLVFPSGTSTAPSLSKGAHEGS